MDAMDAISRYHHGIRAPGFQPKRGRAALSVGGRSATKVFVQTIIIKKGVVPSPVDGCGTGETYGVRPA
jgi:hypothetical protein